MWYSLFDFTSVANIDDFIRSHVAVICGVLLGGGTLLSSKSAGVYGANDMFRRVRINTWETLEDDNSRGVGTPFKVVL